jgi:hypothetical protein
VRLLPVARWVTAQRRALSAELLSDDKVELLQELGFEADEDEAEWLRWFLDLARCVDKHNVIRGAGTRVVVKWRGWRLWSLVNVESGTLFHKGASHGFASTPLDGQCEGKGLNQAKTRQSVCRGPQPSKTVPSFWLRFRPALPGSSGCASSHACCCAAAVVHQVQGATQPCQPHVLVSR